MKVLEIYSDGACSGNPGPAGIGVWIRSDDGYEQEISEFIGNATNNIAEYKAFIRGLKEAHKLGVDSVKLRTDSELLYFQIKGKYKVKHPNMKPLYEEAMALLKLFKNVECKVVPREQNKEADRLSVAALKQHKGSVQDGRPDVFFIGEESPSSTG